MKLEAQLVVEALQGLQDQIGCVEQAIQELASGFPEYKYLKSIPGFGPYVSAVTLAAIGNADRFENRSQLLRLAGLDLSASRSGEKSRTAVTVISKKGMANLRYALYQAALVERATLASAPRPHTGRLLPVSLSASG